MKSPAFIKKVPRAYLILGVAALIVLGVFAYYYLSSFESTDDAFVDGNIVPISAQVKGLVTEVLVKDNQIVKSGDVLAKIDERDYTYKLGIAQANQQAAEAELGQAKADQERYQQLFSKQEISKQEFDRISLRVKNAEAELARAKANAGLAQLDLEHTKIIAPVNGKVSARTIEQGQYVQAGQPLLAVVSSDVWVTANFKETQMKHIKPGNRVTIHVDAYPGVTFYGKVDSIQAGTGSAFSLLPAQNASGNFIKVVQRVPVKIVLTDEVDADYSLRLGLSVVPSVNIRKL